MNDNKLIFLFSLPRSGSTLMQRLLQAHPKVDTIPESWFLLNLLHPVSRNKAYTEYSYPVLKKAIHHLYESLPKGKKTYFEATKAFALKIYEELPGEGNFLLEKTPRYHLIANELVETFPEAKFIFLWRNPLAIGSSILKTWGNNQWNLHSYKVDLYDGLDNLIDLFKKKQSNFYGLNYEHLLVQPEEEMQNLSQFLGIEYDNEMIEKGLKKVFHQMGDQTGVVNYNELSTAPLEKWKSEVHNPLRKNWFRKYLHRIGEANLKLIGYDYDLLMNELNAIPFSMKNMGSDAVSFAKGNMKNKLQDRIYGT